MPAHEQVLNVVVYTRWRSQATNWLEEHAPPGMHPVPWKVKGKPSLRGLTRVLCTLMWEDSVGLPTSSSPPRGSCRSWVDIPTPAEGERRGADSGG